MSRGRRGGAPCRSKSLHTGDGERYLALEPDELVVAVRARRPASLRTGYDKVRVRQSIDYPLAGVAAGVAREGDRLADLRLAFTGTNPRPLLLAGTGELCGGAPSTMR